MGARFIGCDRDQVFLMPPSLRDWVPEGHLVWTVLDAVAELDLSAIYTDYRDDGRGRPAYEPSMMVALLLYAYARGNRSSRGIERACLEDVAYLHFYELMRWKIRRAHPSLRTHNFYPRGYDELHTRFTPEDYGVDTDRGLAIYHRWRRGDDQSVERVTITLNFSTSDQWVDVRLGVNGTWHEVVDGGRYDVRDWRVAGHRVPSHWGHVFVHRSSHQRNASPTLRRSIAQRPDGNRAPRSAAARRRSPRG
jgi:hypothetical protein